MAFFRKKTLVGNAENVQVVLREKLAKQNGKRDGNRGR
jgi:hypothetical protein